MHAHDEGGRQLLRRCALVERRAAELHAVAAALVDRVVAAHGFGMRLAEPLEPERGPDLLVGGGRENEVARRLEGLARQRRERNGLGQFLGGVVRAGHFDQQVDGVEAAEGR